jgi:pimeloyl-ACP methyl ester carboxylesterase
MRIVHAALVGLVSLAVRPASLVAQSPRAGDLKLEPYSFRTYDGRVHPAELGHLWVRENRNDPASRLIELVFVRLKSTAPRPGSPVVFLAGGPGVPGTAMGAVPVYYSLFEKMQTLSDVILLDQRGIGKSSPNTQCPEGLPPAPDVFEKESSFRAAILARAQACAEFWSDKGVDLKSYTTQASADDLEDLRKALGAEKLNLIAHSYGTTLALSAMKRHGEHLDRVVLAGVQGPDQSLQMPLAFDFALRRISYLAAASPKMGGAFPDTFGEFRKVLEQASRQPVRVTIQDERTKKNVEEKVGPFFLQFTIAKMLPNGRKVDRIPALVYSLARGDTSMLAGTVQDFYGALTSGFTGMEFSVSCSDGWSSARRQLAEDQASHSIFGDAPFVQLDPRQCSELGTGIPQPDSLLPFWSPVRTLLVSGTLDSNTPDYQAEKVLWGLPNGKSLLVENGFHETLPSPEVQAAVVAFLSGSNFEDRVIRLSPPSFLTIEEAEASRQPAH